MFCLFTFTLCLFKMPTHFFPLTILTQHFEDETHLSEALNFHEISRFNSNSDNSVFSVRVNAEQTLKDVFPNLLHSKIVSGNVRLDQVLIEISPPEKTDCIPAFHWSYRRWKNRNGQVSGGVFLFG